LEKNKTEKEYWDGIWQNENTAKKIEPYGRGIENYVSRQFHIYFQRVFSSLSIRQAKLLEVGCANSVWLSYFDKEFNFNVSGLDYSQIGCDATKRNLDANGVKGDVICADLFSPPEHILESYDIVISFGVAEHFNDTSDCIKAMLRLLKPNGILITNIPNMAGSVGLVQKLINRPVFDIHNPLDKQDFLLAHQVSGSEVLQCDYFISTNFGVCNLNGIRQKTIEWVIKKIILALLVRASILVWKIEAKTGVFKVSRFYSPYISCVARKTTISNREE
jgi:2-polyprenyl-3-methyl-5-hydroxy-6-metoxy-1,4-benzoquinol methylase